MYEAICKDAGNPSIGLGPSEWQSLNDGLTEPFETKEECEAAIREFGHPEMKNYEAREIVAPQTFTLIMNRSAAEALATVLGRFSNLGEYGLTPQQGAAVEGLYNALEDSFELIDTGLVGSIEGLVA